MRLTRTLIAAAMVCAAATVVSAQPPAPSSAETPTATVPDKEPVSDGLKPTSTAAGPDEVVVIETMEHPLVKFIMPAVTFLAVLVIALFVVRWRKTGELPGPSTGGQGPVAGA